MPLRSSWSDLKASSSVMGLSDQPGGFDWASFPIQAINYLLSFFYFLLLASSPFCAVLHNLKVFLLVMKTDLVDLVELFIFWGSCFTKSSCSNPIILIYFLSPIYIRERYLAMDVQVSCGDVRLERFNSFTCYWIGCKATWAHFQMHFEELNTISHGKQLWLTCNVYFSFYLLCQIWNRV